MDVQKELKKFIKSRKHLVWYVKDYENLDMESIVEHTLNYGNWDDLQKLIKIIGVQKMADIFRTQAGWNRTNYGDKTKNYFSRYFQKYAK